MSHVHYDNHQQRIAVSIFSIYRCDTPNLGDKLSTPRNYISWLANSTPIDIKSVFHPSRGEAGATLGNSSTDIIILGGGGLFDGDFFRHEIDYVRRLSGLKIAWGVGINSWWAGSYASMMQAYAIPHDGFDLVGVRDYGTPFEWVPCASCMHDVFDNQAPSPQYDVVAYLHHDTSNLFGPIYDYLPGGQILDNTADLSSVIRHLASGALVLTNSFHGAYWAQLLGRRVVAFPFSRKFYHFRFPMPLCHPRDWRSHSRMAFSEPAALPTSREANQRFAEMALERINEWHGKLLSRQPRHQELQGKSKMISDTPHASQHAQEVPLADTNFTNAELVQSKLFSAMACPITRGPIEVLPVEVTGHAVRRGLLYSTILQKTVGSIRDFQLDFVRLRDAPSADQIRTEHRAGNLPHLTTHQLLWRHLNHDDPCFSYHGTWESATSEELRIALEAGGAVTFEASGSCELLLYAHPWSGVAEVCKDDCLVCTVDLYEPHTTVPRPLLLELGNERSRITVRSTGRRNVHGFGSQLLFSGIRSKTAELVPLRHVKRPRIRGASFEQRFWSALAGVPADGIFLDVGGGNRQIDDQRYINLDYAPYREPDLIGDALNLPLRDESVDAVYSTGVFEHLSDPLKAGREITRVLKPGGAAVVSVAFLQPVHSEGQHFFNATPWGIQEVFKGLTVNKMSYDTSLSFLMQWCLTVSGLDGKVDAQERALVAAKLTEWDSLISEDLKMYAASGIWIEARKP
jgi:SAM-dependent methyltransferase